MPMAKYWLGLLAGMMAVGSQEAAFSCAPCSRASALSWRRPGSRAADAMRASAREGKYRRGSTRTDDIELESDDRQLASDPSNRRAGDLKTRISRNFVLRMAPVATVMAAAAFECSDGRVQEAAAFDAKEAMRQDYDKFSSKYDELDGGAAAGALGLERARADMIGSARGLVLEVAVGTGLNLPMYRFRRPDEEGENSGGNVDKLVAIDLSAGMLSQAKSKGEKLQLDESQIEFMTMDVERLKFPDATFDTVVDTFSLCVFPDPVAALREMKRVCKPGGRILLLENSISENGLLAAYQVKHIDIFAHTGTHARSAIEFFLESEQNNKFLHIACALATPYV
jgi:methyltransferase OMS1